MSMSLASRLVVIVLLALVGVGAAAVAVVRSHLESDASREATAIAQSESVAQELRVKRDALPAEVADAIARGEPAPPALKAFTTALVATLGDASAGYCTREGMLVARETVVPPDLLSPLPRPRFGPPHVGLRGNMHDPNGMGLLPIDRDFVVAACRSRMGSAPRRSRFVAPRDLLFLTVIGGREPLAAWALVRTPKHPRGSSALASPLIVAAIIVLSMVALVALCVDTVLQIRRGIGTIADALVAVQTDLETPIPSPKTRELAGVAEGLRAMTAHLSEARTRELALERRLLHERRLASLGRVAAGVAHEIRNPLASIKLRLDAMVRRKLDERTAHDVTRSLGEVARLERVVSSLLLVARNQPAPMAELELATLVDERLTALEAFAASKSVRLVRAGAARAQVDPEGMTRVIDNLVRNGIEASPHGTEVVVELQRSEADVVLRVVDHGPGVVAGHEHELFEPFFTSKPDGTGLGLSLSRAAVEAHRGTLTYTRGDHTTSFTVRLPGKAALS